MSVSKNPPPVEVPELTEDRLRALKELIPEAFSEGKIDFDKLRAALGDLVEGSPERYTFGWAGKRDAHGEPSGEPRVYLVAETKASLAREQLRPAEAGKIECGKRHFREALGVRYQVVIGVGEIVSRWDGDG
ncbi:MAG TPA: hypothetical protein VMN57_10765 [Anaerolineales bacterium]|nr:hypothetical protein [Anaerolineales bacterium]